VAAAMMNGMWGRSAIMLSAVMGTALVVMAPASTQERGRRNAVSALQPGLWELRDVDAPGARPRAICIANPQSLLQVEHRGSPCSRLVVGADEKSVTVHYTCPSDGYGLTEVKVDSPQHARIDTQGIKDNRPFQYRADARRIRGCNG